MNFLGGGLGKRERSRRRWDGRNRRRGAIRRACNWFILRLPLE